jgi:NAD+ synthase (glutamine-hydrolysing)
VSLNGIFLAQGSQFTLEEVEVITATCDLDDVVNYRGSIGSRGSQAASSFSYPRCHLPINVCNVISGPAVTSPIELRYYMPEEEILLGPACWLWDYLRRSKMAGFFLPLSGGIDSSSVCCLVGSMCDLVLEACHRGDAQVIDDLRSVLRLKYDDPMPSTSKEIANSIFTTCYMSSSNSSAETQMRAEKLSSEVGSRHIVVSIDEVVSSYLAVFKDATHFSPRYSIYGGMRAENLALQNVQARTRMVMSYLFAQLMPWTDAKYGNLLVLASANVDESLFGYFTKYDCSSADINPIGGICKTDLRRFCKYMSETKFPSLKEILKASPTAELEPITDSHQQTDEEDMGLTYDELSDIGRLRKVQLCGPYNMFIKLLDLWGEEYTPTQVADKVKHFFKVYSINRHKMTTITPSYHAVNYSPDDNRHDLRQFLYNTKWEWQFAAIDKELMKLEKPINKSEVASSQLTSHSMQFTDFTESPHPTAY